MWQLLIGFIVFCCSLPWSGRVNNTFLTSVPRKQVLNHRIRIDYYLNTSQAQFHSLENNNLSQCHNLLLKQAIVLESGQWDSVLWEQQRQKSVVLKCDILFQHHVNCCRMGCILCAWVTPDGQLCDKCTGTLAVCVCVWERVCVYMLMGNREWESGESDSEIEWEREKAVFWWLITVLIRARAHVCID